MDLIGYENEIQQHLLDTPPSGSGSIRSELQRRCGMWFAACGQGNVLRVEIKQRFY